MIGDPIIRPAGSVSVWIKSTRGAIKAPIQGMKVFRFFFSKKNRSSF